MRAEAIQLSRCAPCAQASPIKIAARTGTRYWMAFEQNESFVAARVTEIFASGAGSRFFAGDRHEIH
jgi:hypothetical protein